VRRFLRWLVALLLLLLAAALIALPKAVPPLARQYIEKQAAAFGLPVKASVSLGYCWRHGPGLAGQLRLHIPDSPWRAEARFGAAFGEWAAELNLPETAFSENESTVRTLLARYPVPAVSNLVFSGSVSLNAKVERTRKLPVPVWSFRAPVRELSIACDSAGVAYSVDRLSFTPGASGIANHVDIAPMFLRAPSANAAGVTLTNFYAFVRAAENSLLVTEAGAGVCGGKACVYSLFLDTARLNAGLTLFLDDIDAGRALSHLKGFRGEASGRLHGKLGLHLREGGRGVAFRDAFLYSTPGETGKLRMADATPITDNLAYAGLDAAYRENVRLALSNLDYSVLRLTLRPGSDRIATLGLSIAGSATRGETTVPVDLTVNINGELEQLLNLGLGYTQRMRKKGTQNE